ncbi:MAG: UxaA family hydrolase, partial [Kiritimatiellae bacterium]|nr:UxaA family hydrolase [Kiritimatiellia bacterium]
MVINPLDNVEVRGDGHKYARRDIAAGEDIVKYGMPIAHATRAIAKGEHVHVHNAATNLGDVLEYRYEPDFADVARADAPDIMAYRRADGRAGIRNDIWVVPLVGCVNRLAERLAQSCGGLSLQHPYGCSQMG